MSRLHAIDGLRGLFALWVMSYHTVLWLNVAVSEPVQRFLAFGGYYGVEGFFAISGIALAVSTSPVAVASWRGYRQFMLKRYIRIWPLYGLLSLVVLQKGRLTAHGVLDQTLLFGFKNPEMSSLIGGWSLGVEFTFYFLFPLAWRWVNNRLPRATILACLMTGMAYWMGAQFDSTLPLVAQNRWYVSPLNHAFFFAWGVWTGVFLMGRSVTPTRQRWAWRVVAVAGAGLLLASQCLPDVQWLTGGGRALCAVCTLVLVAAAAHLPLQSALVRWLGDVSFPVYLIHPVVVWQGVMHTPIKGVLAWTVAVLLSLVLAHVAHRWFEIPVQLYLRRSLKM